MKKIAAVLLITLLAQNAYAGDKVVATYKGGEIKESEVMSQFAPMLDSDPNFKGKKFVDLEKNTKDALIAGYINIKLLELETKNSSIENSKEFQDKLAKIKTQMLQQEIVDQYLKNHVTDAMVDSEYAKMSEQLKGKDEFKASHILVDSVEKAQEVKKKLSKGAKFADVAKEFSTDQSTKASGGTLGYFTEGQLVPEFEKQVEKMKVGEISDPVKTQFGWHVIKLEDKRKIKLPSKEEAKQGIMQKLSRDVIAQMFKDLEKKYEVKIDI